MKLFIVIRRPQKKNPTEGTCSYFVSLIFVCEICRQMSWILDGLPRDVAILTPYIRGRMLTCLTLRNTAGFKVNKH